MFNMFSLQNRRCTHLCVMFQRKIGIKGWAAARYPISLHRNQVIIVNLIRLSVGCSSEEQLVNMFKKFKICLDVACPRRTFPSIYVPFCRPLWEVVFVQRSTYYVLSGEKVIRSWPRRNAKSKSMSVAVHSVTEETKRDSNWFRTGSINVALSINIRTV